MPEHHDLPPVLTVEESARFMRISRGAAYAAIRANEIPHIRIGRTIRVPRAALLRLLSGNSAGQDAGQEQHATASGERSDQRDGVAT
jgi:excisionase family DNA binding protein